MVLGSFNLPMGTSPQEQEAIIAQIAKSGVYNPDTKSITFYKDADDQTSGQLFSVDVTKLKTELTSDNATDVKANTDYSGNDFTITGPDTDGNYVVTIQNSPRLGGKAAENYALKTYVTAEIDKIVDGTTIAKTAKDYDVNEGTIGTKFSSIDTSVNALSAKLEGLAGAVVYIGTIDEDLSKLSNADATAKLTPKANEILGDKQLLTGYTILDKAGNEWWYNGTTGFETWMNLGQNIIGHADDTNYGVVKGDGTYVTITDGILKVLKADDATTFNGKSTSDFVLQNEVGNEANKIPKIEASGKLPASIIPIDPDTLVCTVNSLTATLEDNDADKLATITTKKDADIAIIEKKQDGKVYSVTSYIYSNEAWIPMCGTITADNCIMTKNIIGSGNYERVGNFTKTLSGNKSMENAGKTVQKFLEDLFSQDAPPVITSQPAVSGFILTGASAVEAGTVVNPAKLSKATLSAGSYTNYTGQVATGVVPTSYTIKRVTNAATTEVTSGNGDPVAYNDTNNDNGFIIGDKGGDNVVTSLKYTIDVVHGEGVPAKTSLGNTSTIKIAAGTKSQTTSAYSCYRKYFAKVSSSASDVDAALTSAYIRGCTTKTGNASGLSSLSLSIPDGTKRVVIAVPSTAKSLSSVIDVDGMGLDVVEKFTTTTDIDVEGANGYTTIPYKVYVFQNANGVSKTTFNCTFK